MIKIGAGSLNEVFEELEREKGISKEVVISSLCDAMVAAYKKHLRIKEIENVEAFLDEQTGEIGIFKGKTVVESVEDPDNEISLAEAKEIDEDVELGDEVKLEVTPEQFGRIAAQAANQVLTQRIREAERNLVLNEFLDKKGTLITGIIQKVDDRRNVIVNIGKTDAIMPRKEQIPGEYYKPGNRIRVFVLNVKETTRLPQVIVSHGHAEIVRELFELEVPEIEDGIVEIKSISREAGYRTKIAVWSNDPEVDSVGACIGPRGSRIQTIVGELKNEKIDIVRYSEDPVEYIVNALSPARVVSVDIMADDEFAHEALVVVPDDQLSLAIGREGQNVRLAHKLTNWKIDIKSVSQMEQAETQNIQNYEYVEEVEENAVEDVVDSEELESEIAEEMSQQELDEDDMVENGVSTGRIARECRIPYKKRVLRKKIESFPILQSGRNRGACEPVSRSRR